MEPEIHLLDEPLSNFDANLRKEMRFVSRRFHESFGITTHYVTHDQAEAMVISVQIGSAGRRERAPARKVSGDAVDRVSGLGKRKRSGQLVANFSQR